MSPQASRCVEGARWPPETASPRRQPTNPAARGLVKVGAAVGHADRAAGGDARGRARGAARRAHLPPLLPFPRAHRRDRRGAGPPAAAVSAPATSGLFFDACTVPIPLLFVWARVKAHRMADERRAHGNFTKTGLAMGIATPLGMFVALRRSTSSPRPRGLPPRLRVVLCLVAFMASNLFTSFQLKSQPPSSPLTSSSCRRCSRPRDQPRAPGRVCKAVFAAAVGAAVGYLLERTQRGHVVGVMSLREPATRARLRPDAVSAGERSLLARAFSNHRLPKKQLLLTRVELDDLKLDAVLGHTLVCSSTPPCGPVLRQHCDRRRLDAGGRRHDRSRLNAADLETSCPCRRAAGGLAGPRELTSPSCTASDGTSASRARRVGWSARAARGSTTPPPSAATACRCARSCRRPRRRARPRLPPRPGAAGDPPRARPTPILLAPRGADRALVTSAARARRRRRRERCARLGRARRCSSAPELLAQEHEVRRHLRRLVGDASTPASAGWTSPRRTTPPTTRREGLAAASPRDTCADAPLATAVRDATERQPKARPTADDLVARLEVLCAAGASVHVSLPLREAP